MPAFRRPQAEPDAQNKKQRKQQGTDDKRPHSIPTHRTSQGPLFCRSFASEQPYILFCLRCQQAIAPCPGRPMIVH